MEGAQQIKVRLVNGPFDGAEIYITTPSVKIQVPVRMEMAWIGEARLQVEIYELRRGSIMQVPPVYYHAGSP